MIQPSFAAHRLLICEVYTPSGNWSSYPPHKHDVHAPPGEVDLEEIYYYRIDRAEGYATRARGAEVILGLAYCRSVSTPIQGEKWDHV